jgi:LysM repeat protein
VATQPPAPTPTGTAAEPSAVAEITPTPTVPVATEPPQPTPTPTVGPVPTSTPGIARRYRVHPGDTLQFIADKFGVTKKQILAVNDLGDPPQLRYGTYINIPFA